MTRRERLAGAHRARMGIAAAMELCVCLWPVEKEPTTTGHSEFCPTHRWLVGQVDSMLTMDALAAVERSMTR